MKCGYELDKKVGIVNSHKFNFKNLSLRNNITKIIIRRRDPIHVTFVETFTTSQTSMRGIVKAELTEEEFIVPSPRDLQSIRLSAKGNIKLTEVIESVGRNSTS